MDRTSSDIVEHTISNTYTTSEMYRRLLVLEDALQRTLFKKGKQTGGVQDVLFNQYQTAAEKNTAEAVFDWGSDVFEQFTKDNLAEKIAELKKKY